VYYPRQSEDVTSIYSGDRTDDLDDLDEAVRRFGAGGVGHGPISSLNGGLMATHSSAQTTRTSNGGHSPSASVTLDMAMASTMPMRPRDAEYTPTPHDTPTAYGLQPLYPMAHNASPLNQASIYSYDSADDLSLYDHGYCDTDEARPTFKIYNDRDDDGDDSDASDPIEVRRRRPSVRVTPPRRISDEGHGNGNV